jgi:hypothetical protein
MTPDSSDIELDYDPLPQRNPNPNPNSNQSSRQATANPPVAQASSHVDSTVVDDAGMLKDRFNPKQKLINFASPSPSRFC